MTDSRYNLTPTARRVDRYVSKAMTGMLVGGLSGGMTGSLLVGMRSLFWFDILEGQMVLQELLASLPQIWFEGAAAGIVTGLLVGLTAARHTERKFQF